MSAQRATVYHLTETPQPYIVPKREEKMIGFAQTPNDVIRNRSLSRDAKATYTLLASYAGVKRVCWPALKALADDLQAHPNSVRTWIAELEKSGVIYVERTPGKASKFHLLTPTAHCTPTASCSGTPTAHCETPLQPTVHEEEQRRRIREEEQGGETAREAEPTLPVGVELVDGRPRLAPIAYDGEGKPVHSSEAIAYVTRRAYDIPESYERPLRAWIETHGNVIPRQHDVRALMRLVDSAGEAAVTRAIRKMGNEGYLKFSRLETAVREGRNG